MPILIPMLIPIPIPIFIFMATFIPALRSIIEGLPPIDTSIAEVRLRLGRGLTLLSGGNSGTSKMGDGPRYILIVSGVGSWQCRSENKRGKFLRFDYLCTTTLVQINVGFFFSLYVPVGLLYPRIRPCFLQDESFPSKNDISDGRQKSCKQCNAECRLWSKVK